MTTIDFSPLYRNSIGFDRLATMLDAALHTEPVSGGYPPYDIEIQDKNDYAITLAVAGFDQNDLDIQVEKGILTVRGKKESEQQERNYLYKGIAGQAFERKFNLADFVQVTSANLVNGLLTIKLAKEIPEEMKPRSIAINKSKNVIEHSEKDGKGKAA